MKRTDLWNFNNDNEWYTFKDDVVKFINNTKLSKDKVIWCPFDTEKSNFVITLKEMGYKVIYSHIDGGGDFFNYEPKEHYDFIFSNPPFNGKAKVIERLIQLDKPFALIYGIQCFSSGGFVKVLNQVKNLRMIFLSKRMKFFKTEHIIENPNLTPKDVKQPTFHSMWICNFPEIEPITIWID